MTFWEAFGATAKDAALGMAWALVLAALGICRRHAVLDRPLRDLRGLRRHRGDRRAGAQRLVPLAPDEPTAMNAGTIQHSERGFHIAMAAVFGGVVLLIIGIAWAIIATEPQRRAAYMTKCLEKGFTDLPESSAVFSMPSDNGRMPTMPLPSACA